MHLGTKRHGADDITSGERNNLIIWNHATAFRESAAYNEHKRRYMKEGGPPDPVCASFTHDSDYLKLASGGQYPAGATPGAHPWCPPAGREHAAEE